MADFADEALDNPSVKQLVRDIRALKTEVRLLRSRVGTTARPTGPTTARPNPAAAAVFFDTDLGLPLFSTGTTWVDHTGTPA